MDQEELARRTETPFGDGRPRGGGAEVSGDLGVRTPRGARGVGPTDELAALTGLRTGNSETPSDEVLAGCCRTSNVRTGQGDSADDTERATSTAHCAAPRADIIDDKLAADVNPSGPFPPRAARSSSRRAGGRVAAGLNEVRLALGTNLGIDSDTPDEVERTIRGPRTTTSTRLTWMQESLVQALIA
ncbi:DUF2017 family protein [Rhodococcus hoagii]|nr:DUF2017 family protein [Prescottella equi]